MEGGGDVGGNEGLGVGQWWIGDLEREGGVQRSEGYRISPSASTSLPISTASRRGLLPPLPPLPPPFTLSPHPHVGSGYQPVHQEAAYGAVQEDLGSAQEAPGVRADGRVFGDLQCEPGDRDGRRDGLGQDDAVRWCFGLSFFVCCLELWDVGS